MLPSIDRIEQRPGLLVSVRSADEAVAALAGGAVVIDVKEPARGALGRADEHIWQEVAQVVGNRRPISVALGELSELDIPTLNYPAEIAFRKVGFAGCSRDWAERWKSLRESTEGPAWVAVIYVDWRSADAPCPDSILEEALTLADCKGVLIDTFAKPSESTVDLTWRPIVDRIRKAGRLAVVAGGLDLAGIRHLAPLRPDYFAVRGAACVGGSRVGRIDERRVAELAKTIAVG